MALGSDNWRWAQAPTVASIPIALWICTAIVAHFVAAGSAVGVTVVEEARSHDRAQIRAMVREVRKELDVVQVDLPDHLDMSPADGKDDLAPKNFIEKFTNLPFIDDALTEPFKSADEVPDEEKDPAKKDPEEKKEVTPPPEVAPPKEKPPEPEVAKKDPPPDTPEKPQELVLMKDNRIAVRQAAKKDQPDNPNAQRIADDANHVEEETQSRIRSTDQVAENPSPGSNSRGPTDSVGNSDKDHVAQAEDAKGDAKRAPGENAKDSTTITHQTSAPPRLASNTQQGGTGPRGAPGGPPSASDPSRASAGAPGGEGPRAPDVGAGDEGTWSLDPANPGGDGASRVAGNKKPNLPGARELVRSMGLGAGGVGGGGGPSLDWTGFIAAVGEKQLDKERQAAGQSIRSQHRGRYDTNKFERWLPDIENYDPSVKVGNQTALNAAQVPFASYLTGIHNRIHPIFADEFLAMAERLPKSHALNKDLVTNVEIIVSRDEGKVVRMGVTKNSGVTMFDAAALDSIDRASPFGKAPDAIVSSDGYVYLHWEFHRDPVDACSTRNARPFLVKNPKPLTPNIPVRPTKKTAPSETADDDVPNRAGPLLPLRR